MLRGLLCNHVMLSYGKMQQRAGHKNESHYQDHDRQKLSCYDVGLNLSWFWILGSIFIHYVKIST